MDASSNKGAGKNPGKSPGKADGQQDEMEVDEDYATEDRNPWSYADEGRQDCGEASRPERPFASLPPVTSQDHGPPGREWLDGVNEERGRMGLGRVGFRISEEDSYGRAFL